MKLQCELSQPFGGGVVPIYNQQGLKGHTGFDEVCGYGTVVNSYWTMKVYKTLKNPDQAWDGSGFTGVFGIVDNGVELFEALIGHLDVDVDEGDLINKGDPIGHESNNGLVYVGQTLITKAMKAAGDKRGSHRHVQMRPLKRVPKTQAGRVYLSQSAGGQLYENGSYYEVWNYSNGFNGCQDPLASLFRRYLITGSTGYDVFCLQRLIAKEGIDDFKETGFTGYYGPRTFSAVWKFQQKNGFTPTGHIGPKTLALINIKTMNL